MAKLKKVKKSDWEIIDDIPKAGNGYSWSTNTTQQPKNPEVSQTENYVFHGSGDIDPKRWLKGAVDVGGLFNYPLSLVGAAKDAYQGDYTGAALGLIPVLGKAGIHGSTWGKAYTKAINAGIPHKYAFPLKKYGKEATIFTTKGTQGVDLYGDIQEKVNGGNIINDNMGQWKYPGEITQINSNNITMQGVPYDVFGISDTGDSKLMKPGKNYKFKGSKVTEYPIMQAGGRAPIITHNPNDPRLRAYQDSLDLYNYTNLQHQLEPSWSVIQGNALQNLGVGQNSEFAKNQQKLFNIADSIIRNNPRIEWGTYGDPFADAKGQKGLREQYSSRGGNSPDIRSKSNVIKPANFWTGAAANHDYIKPVQPIIYQPNLQQIAQNPNPSRVRPSTTQTYQSLQPIRPKEQLLPMERMEKTSVRAYCPECEEWSKIVKKYNGDGSSQEAIKEIENYNKLYPEFGNIETIPFKKGTYFTRPRQSQEPNQNVGQFKDRVQGKTDYFDKKTGKLLGTYEYGGELPEAGSGYKVIRSSERKGKTHKVIGPDGTVKFFGDSKLGQHPKDPARKKAFYARHAKNLKNNPYFRAFARKTWEEGGMLPDLMEMAAGGQFLTVGGEYHRIYRNADGDIMVNHPKEDKGKWDTINLTDKAGAKTVADGVAATKKWHRENPYAFGGNVILERYGDGGSTWEIVNDEWEII